MNFIPLDLQGAYPRYDIHTSVFAVKALRSKEVCLVSCLGNNPLTEKFLSEVPKSESAIIGKILDKLHSEMDAAEVIKPEDCQLREE